VRLKNAVYQRLLRTVLLECSLVELIGCLASCCFFSLRLLRCSLGILLFQSCKHIVLCCLAGLAGVLWDRFKLLTLRCIDDVLLNQCWFLVLNFRPHFVDFSLIFAEVSTVKRL